MFLLPRSTVSRKSMFKFCRYLWSDRSCRSIAQKHLAKRLYHLWKWLSAGYSNDSHLIAISITLVCPGSSGYYTRTSPASHRSVTCNLHHLFPCCRLCSKYSITAYNLWLFGWLDLLCHRWFGRSLQFAFPYWSARVMNVNIYKSVNKRGGSPSSLEFLFKSSFSLHSYSYHNVFSRFLISIWIASQSSPGFKPHLLHPWFQSAISLPMTHVCCFRHLTYRRPYWCFTFASVKVFFFA